MSGFDTFLWGCVGGGAAYLLIFALPELRKLYQDPNLQAPSLGRIIVALLIAAGFISLGGVTAFFVGEATEAKHAIAYGLGFEATLGGLVRPSR